jgi:hypothetical protein
MHSVVLLWLVIGVVALCVWNAVFFASAYWSWHSHNYTVEYFEIINPRNPQFGLFSLALILVTNLIFGAAINVLSSRAHVPDGHFPMTGTPNNSLDQSGEEQDEV